MYMSFGWGRLLLPLRGALDSLMGLLHVALRSGGAWVEVLHHSFSGEDGAPFEETTSACF
jgi:hypothetical protein